MADNKAALDEYLQTVAGAVRSGNLPIIDAGIIANRLARIVGLSNKQINDELNRRIRYARTYVEQGRQVRSVDLGAGPFAGAQREIIEVLLNRPRLLDPNQNDLSLDDFDVPALRQIAQVLFEGIAGGADDPVQDVINSVDSVEMGNLVVELMQTGNKKGNFEARFAAALRAIEGFRAGSGKPSITDASDHERYLRDLAESAQKQDLRNTGMV
jgi:hypothetical protein